MLTNNNPKFPAGAILFAKSASNLPASRLLQAHTRSTTQSPSTSTSIIVRMWHDDHPPPHIHVEYQGFEAFVEIRTGEITEGRLPRKAAAIVKEWCLRHQEELKANWEHAQKLEPLERIQGAGQDD